MAGASDTDATGGYPVLVLVAVSVILLTGCIGNAGLEGRGTGEVVVDPPADLTEASRATHSVSAPTGTIS